MRLKSPRQLYRELDAARRKLAERLQKSASVVKSGGIFDVASQIIFRLPEQTPRGQQSALYVAPISPEIVQEINQAAAQMGVAPSLLMRTIYAYNPMAYSQGIQRNDILGARQLLHTLNIQAAYDALFSALRERGVPDRVIREHLAPFEDQFSMAANALMQVNPTMAQVWQAQVKTTGEPVTWHRMFQMRPKLPITYKPPKREFVSPPGLTPPKPLEPIKPEQKS